MTLHTFPGIFCSLAPLKSRYFVLSNICCIVFFSPWLKYPASSQKIFSTSYFVYSNKVLLNLSVRSDSFHPPIKHKKVISRSLKSCSNEHKKGLLQNSATQIAITISKISEKANNAKSKCVTSPSKILVFEKKCCTCFSLCEIAA